MDDLDAQIDEFLDESLGEIESRHDLQRRVALGTSVHVEMTDTSSQLRRYMDDRRHVARAALADLVMAEPKDVMRVHELQVQVREYLTVRDWVNQRIDDAVQADDALQRNYGESTDSDDEPAGRSTRRTARARRRH